MTDGYEFDRDYVSGLLDVTGRVRFDVSNHSDGDFTVRPSVRIKPYETTERANVLGTFLDTNGYDFRFVDRDRSDAYFLLDQPRDVAALRDYTAGHSAHLVRELAFVTEQFWDSFDGILSADEVYRLLRTRDRLRYGWRPRGRFHQTPEEFLTDNDVDSSSVGEISIPDGDFRDSYSMEWFAGVFDGLCRYRPSIAKSAEAATGYSMYPIARMHRAGMSRTLVDQVLQFYDDFYLDYGDSSESHTLTVTVTAANNVRRLIEVVLPHSEVLKVHSELMVDEILPRFDAREDSTKTGFYGLFRDFLHIADASGGPFRQRAYSVEFFEEMWGDDLSPSTSTRGRDTRTRATVDDYDSVSLDPSLYEHELGRYQTLVDRKNRDRDAVSALKRAYSDKCQLCGVRLANGDGTGYSEVHHVMPLGSPHDGPDVVENMIVLCPNHHSDFDNGVLSVDEETGTVHHPYDPEISGEEIFTVDDHELATEYLVYHNENVSQVE